MTYAGEASRRLRRGPANTAGGRGTYWLVEERRRVGPGVGTSRLADGRRVLPVFGFEEEADLFVRLSPRGGRCVRRTETDELVSLLRGPFGDVELVALDPLWDAEDDMLDGSVSLTRQAFLDFLRRPRTPARGAGPTGRGS